MTKTEREIIRAAKSWAKDPWSPTPEKSYKCKCVWCNLKRAVLADEKAKKGKKK